MRVVLLLCALLIASDAYALRCGRELVQVGEQKWTVMEKCGEPDFVDRRTAVRARRLRHPFGSLELSEFEEVEIEEWVYNFGPRKFKQLLEFENSILVRIRELDYGY